MTTANDHLDELTIAERFGVELGNATGRMNEDFLVLTSACFAAGQQFGMSTNLVSLGQFIQLVVQVLQEQ